MAKLGQNIVPLSHIILLAMLTVFSYKYLLAVLRTRTEPLKLKVIN
jgi:hypothetical protein